MAVRRIIHKVTYYYKLLIIWPHLISPTSFPQAFMKEPTFLNVPLKIYFFFLFTFFSFMRRSRLLTFKRMLANYYMISDCFLPFDLDCSQSPIFSWDRLDIPRLTVTSILIFKCTEGAGVGDYSFIPNRPQPLSSFDTHARWQPVTQSARSRWSCGKIEDCEQSTFDYSLDRYCSIIHSRLRLDACALFYYLFKTAVLSSPICSCGLIKRQNLISFTLS